jgi:uncharacterized protein YjdB
LNAKSVIHKPKNHSIILKKRKMKKSYILSIIACMLLAVSYVSAQTTINPSMDTFIHQQAANAGVAQNTSNPNVLEVRSSGSLARITFMDIPVSSISSFSAVSSANLNLYLQTAATSTDIVEVYQVTAQGVAIDNSTTWNSLYPSGTATYTLGSSLGSITVTNGNAVNTKYSFNLTSFISGLAPGTTKVTLCIKATGTNGPKDFWSVNYTTDPTKNPALVVTLAAVTGVTVTPSTATVAVGATSNLTATVAPANAVNKTVNWTSSNTGVATVNASSGVVTGVSAGSADITATTADGGFTSTCTVTVPSSSVSVTGVTVSPSSASVNVGATTNLTATIAPSDATNPNVAWSSSAPGVATVNASTGVVTGVSAGSATITATTADGGKTSFSTITVSTVPVTSVLVSPNSTSVNIGATTTLTATIAPSDATNKTVLWTTSAPAVATVSGGVVTGVTAGTATITATSQDGSFASSSAITVTTIPVTGVTVTPNPATVVAGSYITLTATVAPSNAINKTVTWSTSNNAVAIVSPTTGVVTGMAAGTATITATTQDGGFTSSSTVTVSAPAANYVLNPGFELNTAPSATATNWYNWGNTPAIGSVITGNISLGNAVGGTQHGGTNYFSIDGDSVTANDVNIKQDFSGLPNGTYTMKFWFRGNIGGATGTVGGYYEIAGKYNGWSFLTSQWTQKTISNINVTNGTATVNINFNSTKGGSLDVDDVELTLNQFVLVTGINAVSPASKTLSLNETTTLTTTTIPSNASNSVINWSSSNTSVATVSGAGLVTAVSVGTATITATTSEGGYTSTSLITVLANYALNPGFEKDNATVVKAADWAEWSGTPAYEDNSNVIAGNVGLGDVVGGAPHSGTYYIEVAPTIANQTAYGLLNFQNLTNLPNGTYTLTGWFRGNGGSGYLNIGAAYDNFNFANLSHWTQLTIDNVVITNGTCEIQVNYTADNGQKLDMDDIQLRPAITISGAQTSTALTNPNADISVSSSGNLTLDASRTVQSITLKPGAKLTLNSGQTITAGTLTLQSDATGSGTFVDNNTSNPPTLTATVNQYLPVVNRNWYVSSPIASATNTNLSTGTSVVSYNEAASNWTTETGTLTPGKGYISVSASGSGTGNVAFSGTLNTGSVNVGLTRLGSTKSGFNLVGNPYPSYLDFSKVDTTAAKIIPTIWFRTKTALDVYTFDTYNAKADIATTNGAVLVTKLIPPMQAFWVRVKEGQTAGTLNFTNAMRAHADNTNNRMKAPAATKSEQQVLRLQVSNGTNSDEAIILFNQNASNGYDAYDSPKMSNGNASIPEIFTLAGTEQLVINGLNSLAINQELPLGLTPGNSSTLSIKATDFNNFDANTHVILRDYLDPNNVVEQDLTDGSPYTFSSTLSTNRFALVFKTPSVTTGVNGNDANLNISVYKNGNGQITVSTPTEIIGKAIVSIYNTMGQKLEAKLLNNPVTVLTNPTISGVYFIKVQANGKNITAKVVIN